MWGPEGWVGDTKHRLIPDCRVSVDGQPQFRLDVRSSIRVVCQESIHRLAPAPGRLIPEA